MDAAMTEHDLNAESTRVVTFHHVPVKEYTGIRLGPKEQVMRVDWDPDTDWFHVLIMSEQSDGSESA